jgi:methylglutaconyl-CoA hydratase
MTLVRLETDRGLATLTLDSPANRNALSAALIADLRVGLAAATADDTVRVVLLTHTGPVFCSGADLKETATAGSGDLPAVRLGDVLASVWECPKPVVARIGGPARAGGLGLVAAADIAICAHDVTFAFTEVRLGVVPAIISATVLRRLSPRAATELYLTGDPFDAERAAAIGLVSEVVARTDIDDVVARRVASLLRGGPQALVAAKALTRRTLSVNIRDDLADLTELSVRFFTSDEGREGVRALAEKRDAAWLSDHSAHSGD